MFISLLLPQNCDLLFLKQTVKRNIIQILLIFRLQNTVCGIIECQTLLCLGQIQRLFIYLSYVSRDKNIHYAMFNHIYSCDMCDKIYAHIRVDCLMNSLFIDDTQFIVNAFKEDLF